MTLLELRDAFIAEYKLYSNSRNATEMDFPDKLIALWISEAEQDISIRLLPAKRKTELSLTVGEAVYDLPGDFGHIITLSQAGKELERVQLRMIGKAEETAGEPLSYALYYNGGYKILLHPVPAASGTLQLWYSLSTGFYQPSESSSQSWGSFNGTTFSGDMVISAKFITAAKYYLLAKVFDDFTLKYEHELMKLKQAGAADIRFQYRYGL